jgi:ketosteroid isomerase-like protein
MLDPLNDARSNWATALERESVVRDFMANVGNRDLRQLEPFLSPNVVFEPNINERVQGRHDVLRMCQSIFDGFETFTMVPTHIATSGRIVLVEQTLRLGSTGRPVFELLSFASFEITAFQISAWRQLHG